jgi:cytochrome c553
MMGQQSLSGYNHRVCQFPNSIPMKKSFLGLFMAVALVSGAAYAQSQTPAPAPAKGDAKRAASKVSMCIGCHAIPGYKTAFPVVYSVPKIGGQSEAYLAAALRAYKKGERTHPSMRAIAASLSEEDILDLAAYYSQQR